MVAGGRGAQAIVASHLDSVTEPSDSNTKCKDLPVAITVPGEVVQYVPIKGAEVFAPSYIVSLSYEQETLSSKFQDIKVPRHRNFLA